MCECVLICVYVCPYMCDLTYMSRPYMCIRMLQEARKRTALAAAANRAAAIAFGVDE